jgi:phosphoenolpyruvate carboxykinase (ATP)
LNGQEFRKDPNFGFEVPTACPGVPSEILDPRETWDDKAAYDKRARDLVSRFVENFAQYEDHVDDEVKKAAPAA